MKKYIAICLALTIILTSFTGCIADIAEEFGFSKQAAQNNTRETKIDTAYPDDISSNGKNVITVETAEHDLRIHNSHNEYLERGIVSFREKWSHTSSQGKPTPVYVFDIAIQREYVTEYHTAKVTYGLDAGNELEYKSCEIDQHPSYQFTETGIYQYDDGETSIWLNFLGDSFAEIDITYYDRRLTSSKWVSYSSSEFGSNGKISFSSETQWDGEENYLCLDLSEVYDENGEIIDLGYIEVYPDKGIYWDSIGADYGPYKLNN